ncbi:hypothetical protein LEP1GSC193_0310 [Leptospira alstonii serovar Pingchang str. 80-412]|uniref:Uncharacterized protein n=2 Tax=Leptospira alstonii TaxID=28452 RepID=M6CP69_9LEPT|nr:hypothetical protein LEP1GSC194_2064 [Leptospira alstonii serovar Sichuan str. 79601]EQA79120.1 hypothetical protein LEP1GSC193_0310 [Leptospira alstonii serovar Pingchang str. 80-412]
MAVGGVWPCTLGFDIRFPENFQKSPGDLILSGNSIPV